MASKTKYIFITGGVTSSLGKGIIASSLGKLLQSRGLSVTIQKFDPYLNIDPGTLNPYEHGECYVTEDGAETDLDLGHYERFLNVETSQSNNITTGRIYNSVITKERKGEFLGKTVQVIPHITDEIKSNFYKLGQDGKYDVVITEIGGCVGDIESLPFIEAVRQARWALGPPKSKLDLKDWKGFLGRLKNPTSEVTIGLVGKYVSLPDAYKSIIESFIHASAAIECKVNLVLLSSEEITADNYVSMLKPLDGILVAPGFGERGFEGKIATVKYARENQIPYFGICLGMQVAVIEFARNVLGLTKANSTEMGPNTPHPVIDLMEEQKKIDQMGGTMRLGSYACDLKKGSRTALAYGKTKIQERHRHRYEFNNAYLDQIESSGLVATGKNPKTGLVEIVELKDHPWFVGVQFHPEYKSTVLKPQPLFVEFIQAALHKNKNK